MRQATDRPVVVVGHGLIGRAVAARLRRHGVPVVTIARTRGTLLLELEAARTGDLTAALRLAEPRSVVLVHGPSDVNWCEEHPDEALAIHAGTAAAAADAGPPVVLVSTDNVFDGTEPLRPAGAPVAPQNGYGRAKLAAERALAAPGHVVLRVSLVYGWSDGAHRDNFAERCLAAARDGGRLEAPADQAFTPVSADDVATVVSAVALAPGAAPALAHVAGPEHLSRAEFARLAYRAAGADPALVTAVPRAGTAWASRPANSSLACTDLSDVPGLAGYAPVRPAAGLAAMAQASMTQTSMTQASMAQTSMTQTGPEPAASQRARVTASGPGRARYAIDAGGTHTTVVVSHPRAGSHTASFPSLNPATGGPDAARRNLRQVLGYVRDQAGGAAADGWLACAAVSPSAAAGQLGLIAAEAEAAGPPGTLTVSGDVLPLLLAPPLGGAGAVAAVGTGTGLYAGDGTGRVRRAGGYEYLASDEGSAFDLGLAGLRAAGRALDGTGPPTALLAALQDRLRAELPEAARRLAGAPYPKAAVAALAPVVGQAWADGDEVAGELGRTAARQVAMATARLRALAGVPAGAPTVIAGGVVTGSPPYAAALTDFLHRSCGVHPILPRADAAGAALALTGRLLPPGTAPGYWWPLTITGTASTGTLAAPVTAGASGGDARARP
jgi:dTDP-4-dehydrorhamnose reductase/N-acetylglucosamine kinase-like BadF-type ATPase